MTADEVITLLELAPHPEGGHFRETFRDESGDGGRAHSTAIYYLLKGGEVSHWHRVDATEVWHWYAGAPLELSIKDEEQAAPQTIKLGNTLTKGHRPQATVPANIWQSAQSTGEWTLVGCTVAPGFEFEGFEMAPGGWGS